MHLEKEAKKLGINFSSEEERNLLHFAEIVWKKGTTLGLSGRKSPEEILEKDILDSLLLASHFKRVSRVLDAGSGAGFPGIPLKILQPEIAFFIVEAKRKSVLFLEEVVRHLGLEKVFIFWKRIEEFAILPEWKGGFDIVTGRAVAPLKQFFAWTSPLVKPGGIFLLQKGKKWERELADAKKELDRNGFVLDETKPGLEGEQKIIVLRRIH